MGVQMAGSMLSRDDIKKLSIIKGGDDQSYRAASYDLRIGKILAVKPGIKSRVREAGSYWVPAQGMVEVISIETIKVPQNIAGYASVKTGMSRQGLLALNTGILDPGYEGPLSATVVNFGKSDSLLNYGDTFLRLTFHEYQPPTDFKALEVEAPEQFLRKRKVEVAQNFSALFLNLNRHIESSVKSAFWRNLPIMGLAVALITLVIVLTTWAVSYQQNQFLSKDQLKAELGSYFRDEKFESYQKRLTELEKREHELEAKAPSTEPRQPLPQMPNRSQQGG
jgi:deoxycytidine triphosphate deaminase